MIPFRAKQLALFIFVVICMFAFIGGSIYAMVEIGKMLEQIDLTSFVQ